MKLSFPFPKDLLFLSFYYDKTQQNTAVHRNKSLKIYRTSKNSAYKFKKFSVCLSCTAEETPPALLPDNIQNESLGKHAVPMFCPVFPTFSDKSIFSLCFLFFSVFSPPKEMQFFLLFQYIMFPYKNKQFLIFSKYYTKNRGSQTKYPPEKPLF